jgi:4-amino-4-deoxy-L-arabinose transferase-like glycosyltransferase
MVPHGSAQPAQQLAPTSWLHRVGPAAGFLCQRELAISRGYAATLLAVLYMACVFAAARAAIYKPMWNDELFTFYMARLPWPELWAALRDGVDPQPPLYYALVKLSTAIVGETELGVRLPSLVGYGVLTMCLYAVARRYYGVWAGMVAAIVPLATVGAIAYSYEARPYALLLAFAAIALYGWVLAEQKGRAGALLLGIGVAGTACSHYFGSIALTPIVIGELARSYTLRRWNRGVWIALVAGGLPLVAHWPLIVGSAHRREAFWSLPTYSNLFESYRTFVIPDGSVMLAPVLLLAVCAITPSILRWRVHLSRIDDPEAPRYANLVMAAFLLVPFFGWLVAIPLGGFVPRYVITAVIGTSLLLAFVTHLAVRTRNAFLVLALLLATATPVLLVTMRAMHGNAAPRSWALPEGDLIVTGAHTYLQLFHYRPDARLRLSYALRPEPGNGVRRDLTGLTRYHVPLRLLEPHDLVRRRHVLLYGGPRSWVNTMMRAAGCTERAIGWWGANLLSAVSCPAYATGDGQG